MAGDDVFRVLCLSCLPALPVGVFPPVRAAGALLGVALAAVAGEAAIGDAIVHTSVAAGVVVAPQQDAGEATC